MQLRMVVCVCFDGLNKGNITKRTSDHRKTCVCPTHTDANKWHNSSSFLSFFFFFISPGGDRSIIEVGKVS